MFETTIPYGMQDIIDAEENTLEKANVDVNDSNKDLMDMLRYGLPSAAIGWFDTTIQSVLPESVADEDTIPAMFDNLQDGLGKYYMENREGAQTVGELTLGFAPIIGAMKLAKAGSVIDGMLGKGKTGEFLRKSIISSGRTKEDRIADLGMAKEIWLKNKLLSMQDDGSDLIYKNIFHKNRMEAAGDMLKESMAADAAIVLTMNASDTFFPDDMSAMTNAALFLVPDALLTGLSYRFTGTAMRKWMQANIGEDFAKTLNPLDLPQTDKIFREGFRGPGIAIDAVNASLARTDMGNLAADEALRQSGIQRLQSARADLAKHLQLLYNDNPIGHGLTHAARDVEIGSPQVQNLLKHVETDPSLIVPVISAEKLTQHSQQSFFKSMRSRVTQIDGQIKATEELLQVAPAGQKKILQTELEGWRDVKRQLDNVSNPVVLEADGTLTPLAERKWAATDDIDAIRTDNKSDGGEKIIALTKGEATELGMEMGVTAHGKLLFAPMKEEAKQTALGGVSTIQIFDRPSRSQIQKEFDNEMSLNLFAAGRDWHYYNGTHGNQVYQTLTSRQQNMITDWTGTSDSAIRHRGPNDPDVLEIAEAFAKAGFRRQMLEIADDNGTVLLYRGQSKAETKNPTNEVVSTSTNPQIATKFGPDVLKMRVPVDDILFPVGGLKSGEYEFIVKNQATRVKTGVREGDIISTPHIGKMQEDTFTTMSWKQRGYAMALQQKALNAYDPAKEGMMTLHPGSSWMDKDFAVQLMDKFPDIPVVQMAGGGQSAIPARKDLIFQVLEGKFEEAQKLELIRRRGNHGVLKLKDEQMLSVYDTARAVNLPTGTAGGMHPLLKVLEERMPMQGGEIRSLRSFFKNLDEIDAAMAKHVDEARLGEELRPDRKYSGSMLRHDYTPKQKPNLLITNTKQPGRFGPEEIAKLVSDQKTWRNAMFAESGKSGAPFVAGILEELLGRGDDLKVATRPDMIVEVGATNKGIAGQQSQTFINNPVLEALDRLTDLVDKRALTMTNNLFKTEMKSLDGSMTTPTKTFNKILSKNNEASLDLLNLAVNSLRQGWRVKSGFSATEKGQKVLLLETDDAFNKARYQELFGRSLEGDAKLMPDGVPVPIRASTPEASGQMPAPLILDNLAVDTLTAITGMSHHFLDNLNHLRKIRGMNPIRKKDWHIPAVNMKTGTNVYLVDGSGRVKDVVNKPTSGEAWRHANKIASETSKDGRKWVPMPEDTIMKYHDSLGDIWDDARNFQYSEFQTGAATGKLGSEIVEVGEAPLKDLITSLQANYSLLSRHTKATFFESEINYSRSFINANAAATKQAKLGKDTLHQKYEQILLGRPALSPNGYVGKLYYATESVVDDLLRGAWDKVHAVKTPTAAASGKDFDRMQKTLGDYNPFKTVEDMVLKTTDAKVPPSMRAAVSKLNGFTTDMVLRIADMGMPLINFASLLSVTPAVMNAMHRMPDESHEMWLSRIGAVSSPISKDQAIPNTTRMLMQGMDMFFTKEGARIREIAASRGYLKQEVAERLNLWTRPKEGYLKSTLDNAVDFLSKPTDWSENMSRDIAFMTAFQVGKKTFKLDDEAAMLFGHVHGNKIIGDFRPNNRPQMFQGAAGMPMGLFTTWAVNWLQRVFGDLEAGRLGAVGWQTAVQAFLFGAESMPGAAFFIENVTSHDGKRNVVDSIDARYGRTFTDYLMHGTLSNWTGMAINTRADVSLPSIMAGESPMTAIPSLSVMNTLYEGLAAGFGSIKTNGGYNTRQMNEVIATYGVNGAVRSLFEQINGQSVDRRGATINSNVRDWETILPRLFELKSMREMKAAKEIHRDRMQQITEANHIKKLSLQMRAASRGGIIDAEMIEASMLGYVNAGGSPAYWKRWLKEQILTAQFDVPTRNLLKALRQSEEQGKMARYMQVVFGEE